MDKKLLVRNKQIRIERPRISTNQLYTTYENHGVFQICFSSRGCVHASKGYCIMCDYGMGECITAKQLECAFDKAISKSKEAIKVLLLNSFGSILDENEISKDCFKLLLKKIKNIDVKTIIFETHYTTITREKLHIIKKSLPNKDIFFEFGLETSNQEIRENYLLKYIDNNCLLDRVSQIHSYGMQVIANIIVGIPFLKEEEQVNDAIDSIMWCFNHEIDEVELFPMNIRPYTLLRELFEKNEYKVISHWMVIEVLSKIPKEHLEDIHIAWYGNRDLVYKGGMHSVFPTFCCNCQKSLINFYDSYLKNKDCDDRKKLIEHLILHKNCDCYKQG